MARLRDVELLDSGLMRCIVNLSSHRDAVTLLRTWKRAHDVSELIDELAVENRGILMGMRDAIDSAKRLKTAENDAEVRLLVNWVRDVRSKMGSNTKSYQKEVIDTMANRLAENEELSEAVESFGLDSHFTQVVRNLRQMTTYRSVRDSDNSYGKDVRGGLREKITDDLRLTMAVLEATAKYLNEDSEECFEIGHNLEKLLIGAGAPPKARATRSMNESEGGDDESGDLLPNGEDPIGDEDVYDEGEDHGSSEMDDDMS